MTFRTRHPKDRDVNFLVRTGHPLPIAKPPLRFAVLGPNGHLSSSWSVVVERSGEIYVFRRDQKGDQLKASLHKSGRFRIKSSPSPPPNIKGPNWEARDYGIGARVLLNIIFTKLSCNITSTKLLVGDGQWRKKPVIAKLNDGYLVSLSLMQVEPGLKLSGNSDSALVANFGLGHTSDRLIVLAHRMEDAQFIETIRDYVKARRADLAAAVAAGAVKLGEEMDVDLCGTMKDGPGPATWMSVVKVLFRGRPEGTTATSP